jgi:hypothetical protein
MHGSDGYSIQEDNNMCFQVVAKWTGVEELSDRTDGNYDVSRPWMDDILK